MKLKILFAVGLLASSPLSGKTQEWLGYDQHAARHLDAMKEPSLAGSDALRGYRQRVRLLVLPTFEPAYSIRVDLPMTGKPKITVVSESGLGGYSPGKRRPVSTRDGDDDTAKVLHASLETSMVDSEAREAGPISPGGDDSEAIVCTDGTKFVLEYFDREGRHRLIDRHSCELLYGKQNAMMPVAITLHGLGRLPLEWHLWTCVAAGSACGDWKSFWDLMDRNDVTATKPQP